MAVPGIDESLKFHPLGVAVLTISDSRSFENDTSGALLTERVHTGGHRLVGRALVSDEIDPIRQQISAWVTHPGVDIIITTGGTGFAPRDVTPEAILPLLHRVMDGFSIVFHQISMGTIGVSTLQSRAFAGQVDGTFIFCLPGSTGACRDAWDQILALELDSRYRPCSLAGQVPRLKEATA